jgi:hypothetical protein
MDLQQQNSQEALGARGRCVQVEDGMAGQSGVRLGPNQEGCLRRRGLEEARSPAWAQG